MSKHQIWTASAMTDLCTLCIVSNPTPEKEKRLESEGYRLCDVVEVSSALELREALSRLIISSGDIDLEYALSCTQVFARNPDFQKDMAKENRQHLLGRESLCQVRDYRLRMLEEENAFLRGKVRYLEVQLEAASSCNYGSTVFESDDGDF